MKFALIDCKDYSSLQCYSLWLALYLRIRKITGVISANGGMVSHIIWLEQLSKLWMTLPYFSCENFVTIDFLKPHSHWANSRQYCHFTLLRGVRGLPSSWIGFSRCFWNNRFCHQLGIDQWELNCTLCFPWATHACADEWNYGIGSVWMQPNVALMFPNVPLWFIG